MTLTNYTKYVINEGEQIIVKIENLFGFNEKQISKLQTAGATFNLERGWEIEMSKANYLQRCKALRGFQMEYFRMKH